MAVQVKEHQLELDEKLYLLSQLKEQMVMLERRCSLLTAEEEELRGILEQTDRSRKVAEHELVEVAETVNLLTKQVQVQTPCVVTNPCAGLHLHWPFSDCSLASEHRFGQPEEETRSRSVCSQRGGRRRLAGETQY